MSTKVDHRKLGFKNVDSMLDAYNQFLAGGKPTTFAEWYDSKLNTARKSNVLDHPGLPPVDDNDLNDGDPAIAAKLKPRPSLPTLSAAAEAEPEPEDHELVPA